MNHENGYDATTLLPEGASTLAPRVDALYDHILLVGVLFLLAIVLAMVVFGVVYRRREGVPARPVVRRPGLQVAWTLLALCPVAYFYHQGFGGFMTQATAPVTAIRIGLHASSGAWEFTQPNGQTADELSVPVHRPVLLTLTAGDSEPARTLSAPAFRVQRDIGPGGETTLWFEATREGDFPIYGLQALGGGRAPIASVVHALDPQAYDELMSGGPPCPPEFEEDWQWGEQLFQQRGCVACHNTTSEGEHKLGPNLGGVAGTRQPLADGTERMADAAYLRNSILDPASDVVRGFDPVMTPFSDIPERAQDALISYLAHLSDAGSSIEVPQHCGAAAEGQ